MRSRAVAGSPEGAARPSLFAATRPEVGVVAAGAPHTAPDGEVRPRGDVTSVHGARRASQQHRSHDDRGHSDEQRRDTEGSVE
ncbi:hypothetical protein SLITK23_69200 [Streptomyces lividans]|nr:hypothetical protein JCM4020_72090 [Streptomyces coelicolor]BDE43675.1 hypothetical protein SLITK23_69200 [Streptomyces lividans]GHC35397.1 hypothetical protein GCM10010348_73340 [Streptomyces anthocyanicus]